MGFSCLRRLRKSESLRKLVQESRLSISDFILPLFVVEGKNKKEEIPSLPEVFRFSIDNLMKELEEVEKSGLGGYLSLEFLKLKMK